MRTATFARPSPRAFRARLLLPALVSAVCLALPLGRAGEARAQAAPTADLTVTKSGDEAARVGGQITYNLVVTNGGPDTAVNVRLTDPLPARTTFVSADSPTGGAVSFSEGVLTVTFDSIPAFESGSATLVVSVNGDTPRGTTISNTVTASAGTQDPQTDNNTATWQTTVTGPFAGDLLITELRLRGPAGAADEYVELYNNSDTPHVVASVDGSGGYALAASDGVVRCAIPNGTLLPARGHYLCVNSAGYSLDLYPAGEGTTATGDAAYTADIPDNAGVALFRTSETNNFNLANRLDAAGSTQESNALYREGAGYPALSPLGLEYAFYRDNCGKSGSGTTPGLCPTGGAPKDTDNNAADFVFVETGGNNSGAGPRLGAPGPENFSSPIQRNSSFEAALLDPCVGSASAPNRVRDLTPDPANNSPFGTLDIRRTLVNGTGLNVTRLRFRVIDVTTFPAPSGVADLRARTSTPVAVTVDRPPCGTGAETVNVMGTTLEQPPAQTNGGGFNSSLAVDTITLATPLAPGESVNVRFLLGVRQTGAFRFFVNVEALGREVEVEEPPVEVRTTAPKTARKRVRALPAGTSRPR